MADPDPGGQKAEPDELLAELDALLERGGLSKTMTAEQRQMIRRYIAEHEGEIEWLREQCSKIEEGSISADEAQKWFEAFVTMEQESSE